MSLDLDSQVGASGVASGHIQPSIMNRSQHLALTDSMVAQFQLRRQEIMLTSNPSRHI